MLSIVLFAPKVKIGELIVSGGGAHNPLLMAQLESGLSRVRVREAGELGVSGDAKEAFAFAVLAYETLHKRPANVPGATGAKKAVVLGKVCYADMREEVEEIQEVKEVEERITSYARGRGSRSGASSFTSLASSISCTSLLLLLPLALSSCSRTVATEPGVVNFLIESMPTNLDPRIGTDAVSQRLDSLIFSSLVELDAQRIPRGDLAERWETPDPVTYVFHLRSGVKFHDGRPLTSADVKYTFDSILDRTVTSPKRGSLAMIRSIDAPDAATVIFHLQEPYAGFLWDIARPTVGIVPAGSGADFSERLTGSGPFRFVSANQDDNVVIERNDAYFGGRAEHFARAISRRARSHCARAGIAQRERGRGSELAHSGHDSGSAAGNPRSM